MQTFIEFSGAFGARHVVGVRLYFRLLINCALQVLLAGFIACILMSLLLYLLNGFWFLYTSTPVGLSFISSFPKEAAFLAYFSSKSAIPFSLNISLETLKVCLMIAIACRILHVARWFYFSRGIFGKALWGGSVAGLAAYQLWINGAMPTLSTAYTSTILPALFVLPYCFNLAETALPEIGDLFFSPTARRIREQLRNWFQDIVLRAKQ